MILRRGFFGSAFAAFAAAGASASADDEFKTLARQRLELARRQFTEVEKALRNPPIVNEPGAPKDPIGVEILYDWSLRLRGAEVDLAEDDKGREGAMKAHVDRLIAWEKVLAEMVKARASVFSQQDLEALTFFRLEGQTDVIRSRKPG